MITFLDCFILFIVLVIIFFYIKNYNAEVIYVKASDNRKYLVRKLPDSKQAAELLCALNKDTQYLINHLVAKYPNKPEVKRLFENYNPNNISEGSAYSGYTSYSVNKGERIIICIRQKDDNNTFVDKNILLYIVFHETAHLATESIGHEPEFWENFKFILQEAIDLGIYKRVDFAKEPADYCSIKITSSII